MYCEQVLGLDLFIKYHTILKKIKRMFSVQELNLEQQLHKSVDSGSSSLCALPWGFLWGAEWSKMAAVPKNRLLDGSLCPFLTSLDNTKLFWKSQSFQSHKEHLKILTMN